MEAEGSPGGCRKNRGRQRKGAEKEMRELKALADQLSTEGLGGFALY